MRSVLMLAVSLALCASAIADDAGDPGQPCDGGTYPMVECLGKQAAYWDKKLNAAYADLMKTLESKQREQLRAAQRLWVQYRDANCLYYRLGGGSIALVDAAECWRAMTKARAQEFEGNGFRN